MNCPICAQKRGHNDKRCQRIAAYFGYSEFDIANLKRKGQSIGVPFNDVRKIAFFLSVVDRDPELKAVQSAVTQIPSENKRGHTHLIAIIPATKVQRGTFVKIDASKDMVHYFPQGDIAHFGSEEREMFYSLLARLVFHLPQLLLPSAIGITDDGKKFVAMPLLDTEKWLQGPHQEKMNCPDLIIKATILDYILGQSDRNEQNYFVAKQPTTQQLLTLIDNDFSFMPTTVLDTEFHYLDALCRSSSLAETNLETIKPWFDTVSIELLLDYCYRYHLPQQLLRALIARYLVIADCIENQVSIETLKKIYIEGIDTSAKTIDVQTMFTLRHLRKERKTGTRFANFLSIHAASQKCRLIEVAGLRYDHDKSDLLITDNKSKNGIRKDLESRIAYYTHIGYIEVLRRSIYVEREDDGYPIIHIIEISREESLYKVVEKNGPLAMYSLKDRVFVDTFSTFDQALECFAAIEDRFRKKLMMSLSEFLQSFKQTPDFVFFEGGRDA